MEFNIDIKPDYNIKIINMNITCSRPTRNACVNSIKKSMSLKYDIILWILIHLINNQKLVRSTSNVSFNRRLNIFISHWLIKFIRKACY